VKTRPIQNIPPRGILAFNGSLMVRFGEHGDFYVLNGAWEGTYDGTHVLVHRTGRTHVTEPFEEVLELTDEDRAQWYVGKRKIVLDPPEPEDPNPIPF